MIQQYIMKKLAYISFSQSTKDTCLLHLANIAKRQRNAISKCSKKDLTVQCCYKFMKMAQSISEGAGSGDGLALLQFTKTLLVQIYDSDNIQLYLIKIRIYILLLRWQQKENPNQHHLDPKDKTKDYKVFNKMMLFLSQLKRRQCFGIILKDYYSQIERLYIEAIRFKIKERKIKECQQWLALCYEAFSNQIEILSNLINIETVSFTPEENKIFRILDNKIQLLYILYQLQYTMLLEKAYSHEHILGMITQKYQRLINLAPNKYNTAEELSHINTQLLKHHNQHHSRQSKRESIYPSIVVQNGVNLPRISFQEAKRKSIKESVDFIKEFRIKLQCNDHRQLEKQNISSKEPSQISKQARMQYRKSSFFKINPQMRPNSVEQQPCAGNLRLSKGVPRQSNSESKVLMKNRIKAFSLINRMQKLKLQKLKTINPLSEIKSKTSSLSISNKQMLKNGIFFIIAASSAISSTASLQSKYQPANPTMTNKASPISIKSSFPHLLSSFTSQLQLKDHSSPLQS